MASRFDFTADLTSTAWVANEFGIRNSECGMNVANRDRLPGICQVSINVPQTITGHCKNGGGSMFTDAFVSDESQCMGNISILKEGG